MESHDINSCFFSNELLDLNKKIYGAISAGTFQSDKIWVDVLDATTSLINKLYVKHLKCMKITTEEVFSWDLTQ